jgi:serine protease Do
MQSRVLLFSLAMAVIISGFGLAAEKGWLGVSVREMTPSMREDFELGERSGLLIVDVVRDSPADDAGLREDDVLLKYDGVAVEQADELSKLVRESAPGKSVAILIFRNGQEKELSVAIAKRPTRFAPAYWGGQHFAFRLERPRLGVYVHDLNEDLAPYFKVEKNSGVLISEVMEGSAAESAGLKAGDVIIKIADKKISNVEDLFEELDDYEAGDAVAVEFVRQGATEKVEVELERGGMLYLESPRAPAIPRPPVIKEFFKYPGKSI